MKKILQELFGLKSDSPKPYKQQPLTDLPSGDLHASCFKVQTMQTSTFQVQEEAPVKLDQMISAYLNSQQPDKAKPKLYIFMQF
jgi:hypothetical protein